MQLKEFIAVPRSQSSGSNAGQDIQYSTGTIIWKQTQGREESSTLCASGTTVGTRAVLFRAHKQCPFFLLCTLCTVLGCGHGFLRR